MDVIYGKDGYWSDVEGGKANGVKESWPEIPRLRGSDMEGEFT